MTYVSLESGADPNDVIRSWADQVDAVAVDPAILAREDVTVSAPSIVDGQRLSGLLQEWSLRKVQDAHTGHFNNARTVILPSSSFSRVQRILHEWTQNITVEKEGHSYSARDLLRKGKEAAEKVASLPRKAVDPVMPGPPGEPTLEDAHVIVGDAADLPYSGLDMSHGVTIITAGVTEEQVAALGDNGAEMIIDTVPQPFEAAVDAATLEAILVGSEGGNLSDARLLEVLDSSGLTPNIHMPLGPNTTKRFSFVIHPLSVEYFKNVAPLDTVAKVAPSQLMRAVEKSMAHAPPFIYSKVSGVRTEDGNRVEGYLITVGGTPKEIMRHPPEFTYKRLLEAADMAKGMGSQIMGLGAFTKVVGDAGITVAKRAPLPVTTGNSYSASGALWALHDALRKIDLADIDPESGALRGKSMVIGATGAIGSVCARLLALASDELWLVSPESGKLLALKDDIESENPRATIHVSTQADDVIGDMDAIVTATSAAGKKILDIMKVKPGAVITDVARPLDLSAEDCALRPDVLVIESGEIELPGEPKMGDIGLPPRVAFACLAETIVLALENRFEQFTLGRNIEWQKVKEIYRMGIKNDMRLAAISGAQGVFTDADIARVRELALEARGQASVPAPAGEAGAPADADA